MFTIKEILKATKGRLVSGPEVGRVDSVCIDSRAVKKGDLFIAVKGDIFDGHDFVNDVVNKGVRVVLVHKPVAVNKSTVTLIQVKDTTRALGDIARFHRMRFKAPVIALTGSAGKTTTKEMIAHVLKKRYKVLKNEGTQNNHIGVPMTLLKLNAAHQIVVLECGTNQPGDIIWLADVSRPDVAIFTNIGESHLEKLKTPSGVLREKWKLTAFMPKKSKVILNADDALLSKQARASKSFDVVTYGINKKATFQGKGLAVKGGCGLSFSVAGKNVELNSCGTNNVYNALCAYACGLLFRVPAADIISALKSFEFPAGRGQIVRLGRGWLINDAYNANPVSMRSALQTLENLTVKGKKIFVAADMLELGAKAKSFHAILGKEIALSQTDVLICVGALSKSMAVAARAANKDMMVFDCMDVETAQKYLAQVFNNGDAVLVKGSRRMKMEQVVEFLLASPMGAAP